MWKRGDNWTELSGVLVFRKMVMKKTKEGTENWKHF